MLWPVGQQSRWTTPKDLLSRLSIARSRHEHRHYRAEAGSRQLLARGTARGLLALLLDSRRPCLRTIKKEPMFSSTWMTTHMNGVDAPCGISSTTLNLSMWLISPVIITFVSYVVLHFRELWSLTRRRDGLITNPVHRFTGRVMRGIGVCELE
ncbi:hypothetical protein B0T25DRAFT_322484 [Lasiosphaeria hispida]|uniref:Uncharacterized protein n=1 Tax=Lasiosphaeria hispida TaxID=260671 RepID=A0AAJ0M9R7_9PEZI|nr:hypothetical protein B0T25DRAFT_322484 [Lasiosphaeria hispida]